MKPNGKIAAVVVLACAVVGGKFDGRRREEDDR